jgi:hypothetical protein
MTLTGTPPFFEARASLKPVEDYDRLALLRQAIERLDFKPQDVLKPSVLKKMK